jgi:hypothetical protein
LIFAPIGEEIQAFSSVKVIRSHVCLAHHIPQIPWQGYLYSRDLSFVITVGGVGEQEFINIVYH